MGVYSSLFSYSLIKVSLFNLQEFLVSDTEEFLTESGAQDFSSCEPEFLEKCIKMGKAFFDHPENIFPSNSTDINRVCR